MKAVNDYLKNHYMPAFNNELARPAREEGSAFVELAGVNLDDRLSIFHGPRRLGRYSQEGYLLDENLKQTDVA